MIIILYKQYILRFEIYMSKSFIIYAILTLYQSSANYNRNSYVLLEQIAIE